MARIDFSAAARTGSGTFTSGVSVSRASTILGSVTSFIYAQSLQPHVESIGGAGMKVL